jgi:hypothetical protein
MTTKRARDLAKARTASPELVDARAALATKRAGAWGLTLRLRQRYAERASATTLTVNALMQKAMDMTALAEVDGDWRYFRRNDGLVIIVDRLEVAARHLRLAGDAMTAQQAAVVSLAEADKLLAKYGGEKGDAPIEGPTPEMLDRLRERLADPMQALVDIGRLSDDDLSDAREIASIIRYVTIGMGASAMRFEAPSEGDAPSSQLTAKEASERLGMLHAKVYVPWCHEIGHAHRMVISLVVEGESVEALRRRYGVGWINALDTVKKALLGYRRMRRTFHAQEAA